VKLECFEFVNVLQQVNLFYNNVEITGSICDTRSLLSIVRTRFLNPEQPYRTLDKFIIYCNNSVQNSHHHSIVQPECTVIG